MFPLAAHMEYFTARDEDFERKACLKEGGQQGCDFNDLLKVIQEQKQVLLM